MESSDFWSFFWGGLALGSIIVLHAYWMKRLLSVSGLYARMLRWRADEADRLRERALESGELDASLWEATRERFGAEALAELMMEAEPSEASESACDASPRIRLPVSAGLVFLVATMLGGALSAVSTGALEWRVVPGDEFARLVGTGASAAGVLLAGGFLVGFGARMAGGCTSGHGLCGMARLQRGSLVATAAFFAGGVAVSLLLEALA